MKTSPLTLPSDQDASGRSLGEEEIALVSEALRSGTLTSTKGAFTKTLEERFAKLMGVSNAYACSSGTSAIHAAISAVNPEPGDEIICSPITDMGALTPVLYQAAIPVFADVCPKSLNLTANTIYKALSPKTKAIVVTHLFGNPANLAAISQLAKERNILLIEDCAQAFLATHQGRLVGTWGDIGCFSLQQGKHITTGEGGLVVSNNPDLARRMFLFINKAWGYGDAKPDHYFIALNSRMSELQGAVAVAQLEKLADVTAHRINMAARLTEQLAGLEGIATPATRQGDVHSFWKYCLTVDPAVIPGGSVALGARLKALGVLNAPRYIVKPAFRCEIFRDQRTFGNSRFPFTLARPEAVDYSDEKFAGTLKGLENVLVLPWNERYQPEHVDFVAQQIRSAVTDLLTTKESAS
jgi:dTDP-4-amino-4,6-dideoxygalactose transaminase